MKRLLLILTGAILLAVVGSAFAAKRSTHHRVCHSTRITAHHHRITSRCHRRRKAWRRSAAHRRLKRHRHTKRHFIARTANANWSHRWRTYPPSNTSLPVISGTAAVGQTLTSTTGGWANNPTSYAYQWRRCTQTCTDISGATTPSYAVQSSDVNYGIDVIVTAYNSAGSNWVASAATAIVPAPQTATPTTTTTTTTSTTPTTSTTTSTTSTTPTTSTTTSTTPTTTTTTASGVSSPTPPPVNCDLYASPAGSDSTGNGSLSAPFGGLVKLDQSLAPGQTGCLLAGTYGSTSTYYDLSNSGSASGQITLSAAPGQSVTVKGWVDVEAGYTTIEHFNIDGSNTFYNQERSGTTCPYPVSQGLVIAGPNDVFQFNNYYQSVPSLRGNGLGIGWWGNADNTIIRYNKIHDVGQCDDYDHLIYLSHGNNVQIYDNWMWNDPNGWGVQLYPDPSNAKVFDNVIANTGSGFTVGDESGDTVNNNQIYNNVVMNSTGLAWAGLSNGVAISDYWGGSLGTGNTFSDNISYANSGGVAKVSDITLSNNLTADPLLVDPGSGNFTPTSSSPAANWGLWDGSGI